MSLSHRKSQRDVAVVDDIYHHSLNSCDVVADAHDEGSDDAHDATMTVPPHPHHQLPHDVIEPFVEKYIQYYFNRSIYSKQSSFETFLGRNRGSDDAAKSVVECVQVGDTPLHQAIRNQEEVCVIFMILLQDKINLQHELQRLQQQQGGGGTTTTTTAIENRRRSIMIQTGFHGRNDDTPLRLCVKLKNETILKLLLEHCYDISMKHTFEDPSTIGRLLSVKDSMGDTVLHFAINSVVGPKTTFTNLLQQRSKLERFHKPLRRPLVRSNNNNRPRPRRRQRSSKTSNGCTKEEPQSCSKKKEQEKEDDHNQTYSSVRAPEDLAATKIVKLLLQYDQGNYCFLHCMDAEASLPCFSSCAYVSSVMEQVDKQGRTPLHLAVQLGLVTTVQLLLDRLTTSSGIYDGKKIRKTLNATVAPDQWTALHYATYFGYHDIVQLLINHNNNNHTIDEDNEEGKGDVVEKQQLRRKKKKCQPRHAVTTNEGGRRRAIVDVNAKRAGGWTPLHVAASKGYLQIVRLLLSHKYILVSERDANGRTALDLARDEYEYEQQKEQEHKSHAFKTQQPQQQQQKVTAPPLSMIVTLLEKAMGVEE